MDCRKNRSDAYSGLAVWRIPGGIKVNVKSMINDSHFSYSRRATTFIAMTAIALAACGSVLGCGDRAATSTPTPATPVSLEPTPAVQDIPRVLAVSARPRESNSLIVDVTVDLDRAAAAYIEYENPGAGAFRTATSSPAVAHHFPVVRLRAATTYSYRAVAVGSDGSVSHGPDGQFTTGPLPPALSSLNITASGAPTSELVMMDLGEAQTPYILFLDEDSKIVWYFAPPNPFAPTYLQLLPVRQKPNHNIVYMLGNLQFIGQTCCMVEITPDGKIVDMLSNSEVDKWAHHDQLVVSDTEVLYLADEAVPYTGPASPGGTIPTRIMVDSIRLWDQANHTTRKLWDARDHFSTDTQSNLDYLTRDRDPRRWLMANSISIGPRGNYIVSLRTISQVISISPDFQSIEWKLGGPDSDYYFPKPEDRFYHQHTASQLPNGNILLYDNGMARPAEEGGEYTRAIELALHSYDMSATKVWEYRATPDVFGRLRGGAYRLPSGNTLVNMDTVPRRVAEVGRDGSEVWKMTMEGPTYRTSYRAYPAASIAGETRLR